MLCNASPTSSSACCGGGEYRWPKRWTACLGVIRSFSRGRCWIATNCHGDSGCVDQSCRLRNLGGRTLAGFPLVLVRGPDFREPVAIFARLPAVSSFRSGLSVAQFATGAPKQAGWRERWRDRWHVVKFWQVFFARQWVAGSRRIHQICGSIRRKPNLPSPQRFRRYDGGLPTGIWLRTSAFASPQIHSEQGFAQRVTETGRCFTKMVKSLPRTCAHAAAQSRHQIASSARIVAPIRLRAAQRVVCITQRRIDT